MERLDGDTVKLDMPCGAATTVRAKVTSCTLATNVPAAGEEARTVTTAVPGATAATARDDAALLVTLSTAGALELTLSVAAGAPLGCAITIGTVSPVPSCSVVAEGTA